MPFLYVPFKFSALPKVRCAFQIRSQISYICESAHKAKSKNYGDYSIALAAEQDLDGNISYMVNDIEERVLANRQTMQEVLGFNHFAEIHQVHTDEVIFNPAHSSLENSVLKKADGLACNQKNFALMVKSADCQSILIAHKGGEHIMAIHVGWRGNKIYFPRNSIDKFCEFYRLAPADLYAVRGPSLGPNMAEFTDFEKDWSNEFKIWYNHETKCMDLWSLTKYQLVSAGLKPKNIFSIDLCTATMHETFFSYRQNKSCGRLANLIWISE